MPASGKTTIAIKIAEKYGMNYLCGGDILKEMAVSKGYQSSGANWWDTENGMRFLEDRKKSYQFDREVDEKLVESIVEGGVVVTSYTAPWLSTKGVKIWLKASPNSRSKRLASRDKIPYKEAEKIVKKRDSENIAIYRKIYGFKIDEDLSVFHLVLDTNSLSKNQVIEIVFKASQYFI
jgi:cytidylate kinase|tara:strand:+ start:467 stop:1000 length:534 start_codon:yes stop_codon:yes gene_type:complete